MTATERQPQAAPTDVPTFRHFKYVPYGWARSWPSEEVWKARKRG